MDVRSELRQAALAEHESKARITDVVTKARRQGLSWEAIADCIGTTKQSAWERFHDITT